LVGQSRTKCPGYKILCQKLAETGSVHPNLVTDLANIILGGVYTLRAIIDEMLALIVIKSVGWMIN
jgi:hypothetical protein